MFDYSTFKLLHQHGDEWVELKPAEHDAAAHDPEPTWMRHPVLFLCTKCDEAVRVVPNPAEEEIGVGPPG